MKGKGKFKLLFSALTMLMTPVMAVSLLSCKYAITALHALFYVVASFFLYKRFVKKAMPRYPLGIWDPDGAYLPRSNIPRPIHADLREHPEYFRKRGEKQKDRPG